MPATAKGNNVFRAGQVGQDIDNVSDPGDGDDDDDGSTAPQARTSSPTHWDIEKPDGVLPTVDNNSDDEDVSHILLISSASNCS